MSLRLQEIIRLSHVEQAIASIFTILAAFTARIPYLVIAFLVFLLFFIAALLSKKLIARLGHTSLLDATLIKVLAGFFSFTINLLGLLVAAVIIFPNFHVANVITGLGITSVAIGFAMKDVLQNFFAGVFILWRKPFRVGQEIRSSGYEGRVEEINIRSTRIRTYDGTLVVIPNGTVYTSPILVQTDQPYRRSQLNFSISYQDSVEQAQALAHQVLQQTEGVLQDPAPWVYVSELAASSIDFTIYYWSRSEQTHVLRVRNQLAASLKQVFDQAGFSLASYPHEILHVDSVPPELTRAFQPVKERP